MGCFQCFDTDKKGIQCVNNLTPVMSNPKVLQLADFRDVAWCGVISRQISQLSKDQM